MSTIRPSRPKFVPIFPLALCALIGLASGLTAQSIELIQAAGRPDWLIDPSPYRGRITVTDSTVVLDNGLVRRTITRSPSAATIAVDNLMTGASLVRAVEPEAMISVDGHEYRVGGLVGQKDRAYLLPSSLSELKGDAESFQLTECRVGEPVAPFRWQKKRHAADLPFPPAGSAIDMVYRRPLEGTPDLTVTVHYEIYDGIPVIGKWISVTNEGSRSIRLDRFQGERLACVEAESAVDERPQGGWRLPLIDVLSDYMFKGMDSVTSNQVSAWEADPAYETQVHYGLKTPSVLVVRPPVGPGVDIRPGETWTSFRSYLVIYDSTDRERQGLTQRRTLRILAPWTTENPLMMHVRSADSALFREAVDQCAAVGFEMIIYTFGSGLNMESDDPAYLAQIKADVDYAHSRGIEVGGYSLFSSRSIDAENDVINPKTGQPGGANFGNAPCFGSRWGQEYNRKLRHFIETTGLDLLEHDGPYPGDVCGSTTHPGHRDAEDSQWVNWKMSADLYSWCRERGVYVNQPDYYFLAGGNKTAMGYRESNWSLPRAQQLLHARQNIFDGTWTKPQSAGWMFVPLTEYHGGGAAATLEPLSEHLPDYEAHLANTLGSGVQACWRGPRLYDTDATRDLVARWVTWYKQHRDILESDLIHVRRADGREIDYMVQVNPQLPERAFSMIHNPLDEPVHRTVTLPLYYTGLTGTAQVHVDDGQATSFPLDARHQIHVPVEIPAHGRTKIVVRPTGELERRK
ncbi:MAG: hypothetical protein U0795_17715 [Pirellulales bacterium]